MAVRQRATISLFLAIFLALPTFGHSMWRQRNEPGHWTVALYHCDEEFGPNFTLENAASDSGFLDLLLSSDKENPAQSVSGKAWYLDRAVEALEPCRLMSLEEAVHPTGDLSIEVWIKMLDAETDVQIGFTEGASLRIAFSESRGDRFHLLGANSESADDRTHSAPGFESFPRFSVWNHFGVTIHAPNVESIDGDRYRYGEGCIARFFFNSHAVGYVDGRTLDIEGLTFAAQSPICLTVFESGFIFDEIQISRCDWSVPEGHEGEGHGEGASIEHAFENGRVPASLVDWSVY